MGGALGVGVVKETVLLFVLSPFNYHIHHNISPTHFNSSRPSGVSAPLLVCGPCFSS
jgi:hypothetical protein